ncbi:MAG: hypothetical protein LBB81_09160 [Treponema sp.]|jgi:two-component system chemotaxis sensor kinase CheA|nr:hypothetical protein [Treponema sp.]
MAKEKDKKGNRFRKMAISAPIITIIFIGAAFIIETLITGIEFDTSMATLIIIASLAIVISFIRYSHNFTSSAFYVPVIMLLYYMALMTLVKWNSSYLLFYGMVFCVISCIFCNPARTIFYIITENAVIIFLVIRGVPVAGPGASIYNIAAIWAICLLGSIIMVVITRSATISLDKALEHQNSLRDLLSTTENYIAMVDERNEIVYASKTLSQLGDIQEAEFAQGRPFIDLFPGKSLKLFAGKLLKEKDLYAEDWEFSLNGQKRYFKAASHSMPGNTGGSLISLYDMTQLAERDEIAAMKDSMKIGLFFMDQKYVIQDHYSRFLEEMLSEKNLFGQLFTDIISDSVTPPELEAIKDYFAMVIERTYDQDMLDDINPLNELHYINTRTGNRKVFQCAFTTVERGHGEIFLLVTIYDITVRVELQKRLQEEEARRQEEMQSVFELIQVEQDVFSDFEEDMEYEFGTIDKILKDDKLSRHEVLVKVYQSIHAIKSNAVILGLNVFGNKVHQLESKIKVLREQTEEVPFVEMLNLAMDIEKISQEREGFRAIQEKLASYGSSTASDGIRQNVKVLVESLAKTTSKAAADMGKEIQFLASDVEAEAINIGPRRIMKEVLMQLIRNSCVHGIEEPRERAAKGKKEQGTVKLSIKLADGQIQMKLSDDGKGLDYPKIAEKAIEMGFIKPQDSGNQDVLMKVIFMPGFSTAETEGVHAGRGIGLNLVRDRIKEIGGTIKLRSETDKGVIFFVSIPVGA